MREYPEILEHYDAVNESGRLSSPHGRLELLRTQSVIRRYLPAPPSVVYDIGGGTGPYTFWLSQLGHEAHLIDLVPSHIEQAHERMSAGSSAISSASVGDARQLELADCVADAVLLLGPLYHLPEPADREECWREAARVLKPSGIVVAATISRFASLLDGLSRNLLSDPAFRSILAEDLRTGIHINPTDNPVYFTTAFLQRPSQAAAECLQAGFAVETLVGVEGPAWLFPDLAVRMADEASRSHLLSLLEQVETEDSLLGVSSHVLVVGRKPKNPAASAPQSSSSQPEAY